MSVYIGFYYGDTSNINHTPCGLGFRVQALGFGAWGRVSGCEVSVEDVWPPRVESGLFTCFYSRLILTNHWVLVKEHH